MKKKIIIENKVIKFPKSEAWLDFLILTNEDYNTFYLEYFKKILNEIIKDIKLTDIQLNTSFVDILHLDKIVYNVDNDSLQSISVNNPFIRSRDNLINTLHK